MCKRFWPKSSQLKINAPSTGSALMVLALTQIPMAIKTAAEVACIGEISHQSWKKTQSHQGVNVLAVTKCNGG